MSLFVKKTLDQVDEDMADSDRSLKRELNAWDIAIMGVAVAVGAGIFSVGAQASSMYAGPAVIISFVIAAVVCGLAVMNYAEFSSSVPISGSAYTFSYMSLGELIAWIIGWDLILEMVMAASVISKYWGIYMRDVFELLNLDIPTSFKVAGIDFSWPPILIVGVFTALLVLGTKFSTRVNGFLTVVKIGITIFIIIAGAFYVHLSNYKPFLPATEPAKTTGASGALHQSLFSMFAGMQPTRYGMYGLLGAAALIFFAFIGFDIVVTTAEEVKNPQKTLPKGIFGGLALVSFLYIAVTVVVTGMVSYKEMAKQKDPSLATAFQLVGAKNVGIIITIGILIGLTTSIMVLLLGFTRIVFSMSRDGLLPRSLSTTSSRNTPARLQVICGIIVAVIAAVADVNELSEMINIGTLSAFVVVSFSVPILRRIYPNLPRGFKVPFSPWLPILSGICCLWLMANLAVETWLRFIIWLTVGLTIYFAYSFSHSRVQKATHERNPAAALKAEINAATVIKDGKSQRPTIEEVVTAHIAVADKRAVNDRNSVRVAGILTSASFVVIVISIIAALSKVISLQTLSSWKIWGLILIPLPGLVASHISLNRAARTERELDLILPAHRSPKARPNNATRIPLKLLSLGYAAMTAGVVLSVIHLVMSL